MLAIIKSGIGSQLGSNWAAARLLPICYINYESPSVSFMICLTECMFLQLMQSRGLNTQHISWCMALWPLSNLTVRAAVSNMTEMFKSAWLWKKWTHQMIGIQHLECILCCKVQKWQKKWKFSYAFLFLPLITEREHTKYYGLNMCVPQKFVCWSPNHQCDVIWRWGFWELIRCRWSDEERAPLMEVVSL